jgi:hypothetical protein
MKFWAFYIYYYIYSGFDTENQGSVTVLPFTNPYYILYTII